MHMAQLMPLSLTVSCLSRIQIGFTFLVPAHLGSPGQRAVKRVCVCVCVCVCERVLLMLLLTLEGMDFAPFMLASLTMMMQSYGDRLHRTPLGDRLPINRSMATTASDSCVMPYTDDMKSI